MRVHEQRTGGRRSREKFFSYSLASLKKTKKRGKERAERQGGGCGLAWSGPHGVGMAPGTAFLSLI